MVFAGHVHRAPSNNHRTFADFFPVQQSFVLLKKSEKQFLQTILATPPCICHFHCEAFLMVCVLCENGHCPQNNFWVKINWSTNNCFQIFYHTIKFQVKTDLSVISRIEIGKKTETKCDESIPALNHLDYQSDG